MYNDNRTLRALLALLENACNTPGFALYRAGWITDHHYLRTIELHSSKDECPTLNYKRLKLEKYVDYESFDSLCILRLGKGVSVPFTPTPEDLTADDWNFALLPEKKEDTTNESEDGEGKESK